MYILKKTVSYMPNTPYYRGTPAIFANVNFDHRTFGTFKRYRAKVFRWRFQAWYANLWFQGTIEKIHFQL